MNPTSEEIFGVSQTVVNQALTLLGIVAPSTDARRSAFLLIESLASNYQELLNTRSLNAYQVAVTRQNLDIDTQRRTYLFTLDLSIDITNIEDEPV